MVSGADDPIEDRFMDCVLDLLWKQYGEESAAYQAALELMLDRRKLLGLEPVAPVHATMG